MKIFLRHIFVNFVAFYLLGVSYPGLQVDLNTKTLLTASIIWFLLNKIIKPIIKLLLLPINLITLNLFTWLIGLITLFLLQIFADGISVKSFQFQGLDFYGFIIPAFFVNLFFSYIITSVLLNWIHSAIFWLFRKDTE
ncbi:hypothetical protein A2572_04355 [Candidatus Collierbacteria bacterium RIFOXYD1_FULL_40_9]|uniref:Phage holin family protein n=1 Tax=Candidatus Collierbacteria bacterium RIFOXYD1_FULL_40_9 TaxID=1817731 RepID=A0A1F5FPM4_9BACT|nr:MAG: hypothetical protein A2572_04355 [Candidatus Collierbacteria bacterium RIFOXYD1_FULL_40_9]